MVHSAQREKGNFSREEYDSSPPQQRYSSVESLLLCTALAFAAVKTRERIFATSF